ncbi:MAG: Uma2 family endonuclease [Thiotrichales bacterium]
MQAKNLDPKQRYTYKDYAQWPEEERYELLEGEAIAMVAPTTQHQRIVGELFAQIHTHLRDKPCEAFVAPFDIRLPKPGVADDDIATVLQPDISVICDPGKIDAKGCRGAPDWVIEVLSPSTASKDLIRKLRLYAAFGVREYWAVHPADRLVYVWELKPDQHLYEHYRVVETVGELPSVTLPELAICWEPLFPPLEVKEGPAIYTRL